LTTQQSLARAGWCRSRARGVAIRSEAPQKDSGVVGEFCWLGTARCALGWRATGAAGSIVLFDGIEAFCDRRLVARASLSQKDWERVSRDEMCSKRAGAA